EEEAVTSAEVIRLYAESGFQPQQWFPVDVATPGAWGLGVPGGVMPDGAVRYVAPLGREVSSYILHFDAPGNDPVNLSGEVTFGPDAVILGVIFRSATLSATDDVLGDSFTRYPSANGTDRDWEM